MRHFFSLALSCTFAAALCAALPASSQTVVSADPSTIPTKDFAEYPQFSELRLSQDGQHLAALVPVQGHANLYVLDLATKKGTLLTAFSDYDVNRVAWVNNNRLVYSLWDRASGAGEQDGGGLFAINLDATGARELSPTGRNLGRSGRFRYRGSQLLRRDYQNSDNIYVLNNERDLRHPDVYLLNTVTGRKELLTFVAPPDVESWVLDRAGVARAAVSSTKGETHIFYRESADAPWTQLAQFPIDAKDTWRPIAFDGDNKTMFVASNLGRDTDALYTYDFANQTIGTEPVAASGRFDLSSVSYDETTHKVIGIAYDGERETSLWFDPTWRALQAAVDKSFPDHVNILSGKSDIGTILVYSYSDVDPGRYYLFSTRDRKIEELLAPYPWIKPEQMSPMRFITYKARDGMEIPGYLTIPKNADGKKVPLIVDVHGGPYVRGDDWRFDPEVQFLASRGYAVLQPEFRGSTGFGKSLYRGGWKTWGLAMQDDVTDGVKWAAAQGLIDASRVCILGASYGGYAVMMGLAKDPDLYRCGVNFVGVTDINLMYEVTWSDFNDSDWQKFGMPVLVGDPDKDAAQLKATSPIEQAAKITKPVLMAYGGLDRRVPIIHGERMRDALKANGTPVEWIVYSEEAHGWVKVENKIDFYNRVDKFLAQYLKP